MILALLLACGQPDAVALPATTDLAPLEAPRLLRRISIDLRGVLPSTEELDAVEADPDLIGPYRDAWLEDPRFETRLADLLADRWYTRIDEYHVFYPEYDVLADQPDIEYPFERSVGDEPLRLMSWIVAHDRPWSEVVTADYTVANELLESIWPIVRDSTEPGWQPAHYTDGRPAVGVLASNGLWWRYVTTVSNYNRARVAAIMRLLICEDIQSRPVTFAEQPALADGDNIEAALRENPYCLGCHSAIDPIAATLFGFWAANQHNATEISIYHPDREALGGEQMGVSPAWYGTPVYGLMELGPTIAADPRFDRCAVQSMAEIYWQRASLVEDEPTMEALGETYAAAGGELKPVIAALMETASYQAGALGDDPSQELEEAEVVTRQLGPSALDTIVEDLSGFHWTWEGFEQLKHDSVGHRLLAGGVDGTFLPSPQETPSLTWVLVTRRLAEAAAATVVPADLAADGGERRLLGGLSVDHRPGDEVFDRTLGDLVWRLFGRRPTEGELAELSRLWTAAAEAEDTADDGIGADEGNLAWQAVLVSLLRDPDFLSY